MRIPWEVMIMRVEWEWGDHGNSMGYVSNHEMAIMGASQNGLCPLQNSNGHGKDYDEPGNLRD